MRLIGVCFDTPQTAPARTARPPPRSCRAPRHLAPDHTFFELLGGNTMAVARGDEGSSNYPATDSPTPRRRVVRKSAAAADPAPARPERTDPVDAPERAERTERSE